MDYFELPSNTRWYAKKDKAEAGRLMVAVARALDTRSSTESRRRRNLRHARLYSNRDLSNIYEYGVLDNYYDGVYLTMNVGQSCVDTIASKVSRSKPRGSFQTEEGNWSHHVAAKKLSRFCDGVYYQNQAYAEGRQVFVDSTLFGTGVLWGTPDFAEEQVRLERGLSDEVLIDETEAIDGVRNLRNLTRKKWVHKDALLEWYVEELGGSIRDEAAKLIKATKGVKAGNTAIPDGAGHMVAVYMAYHLPYRRGGDDGRYCIAIDGAALHYGPWRMKRFPAAFLNWERGLTGFWGRSLMEGLVPIQLKINETIETIDAAQNFAVPKVFIQEGMLNAETWTNAMMEVLKVNGPPSQAVHIMAPNTVPPEIYEERRFWWQHGFEYTGISALSAFGEKPAGLTSGAALREVLDRDDLRFTPKGQQWEEFLGQDVPDLTVQVADEMHTTLKEQKKRLVVQVPGDKFSRSIDWASIDLPRQAMIIRPYPTSSLPTTPGARKEYALELFNAGGIDKVQFLQLLELPDTTKTIDLVVADLEWLDYAMEQMLEHQRYEAPDDYLDLQLARSWAMQHFRHAKMHKAPDKALDLVARFIDECTDMLEAQAPAAAAEPVADVAAAQGQAVDPAAAAALAAEPAVPAALPVAAPPLAETVPAAAPVAAPAPVV